MFQTIHMKKYLLMLGLSCSYVQAVKIDNMDIFLTMLNEENQGNVLELIFSCDETYSALSYTDKHDFKNTRRTLDINIIVQKVVNTLRENFFHEVLDAVETKIRRAQNDFIQKITAEKNRIERAEQRG